MIAQLRHQTWNWMLAFLEVAERGSIAEASQRLHLTPAAVSRTLRLLEEEIEEPLFNRVGRGLVLNSRGERLRDAVRRAVHAIDKGLGASLQDPFKGTLRVASLGVLTEYFAVPVLLEMKKRHAALIPEHVNVRPRDAMGMLIRGEVDVALYYEEMTFDNLEVEKLGTTPTSLFCGRGHPLFSKKRSTESMILKHAFSVPEIGDTGRCLDGWPTEVERVVGMRISQLQSNVQACRSGEFLTVLPDIAAERDVKSGRIRRLPFRKLPPVSVFAARSASCLAEGPTNSFIEAIRQRLSLKKKSKN